MIISQISVFVENEFGRLSDVTEILTANQIDIRALSIADTTNFGILRLIVNAPEKALQVLREEGFTVSLTKVIAVRLEDTPGSLNNVLQALKKSDVSVEYAYAFITRKADDAYVILRIEDLDNAIAVLLREGFTLMAASQIYQL